jgi:hypothetical protein
MEDFENGHMREFSITNFLLVTGLSFLGFTGAMQVLDGITIRLLLNIGLVSLGLGVLAWLLRLLSKILDRPKQQVSSPDN